MNPMNQAPEFDFSSAIKELAEAEWTCHALDHLLAKQSHALADCTGCKDSPVDGRIVPFASLRVPMQLFGPEDEDAVYMALAHPEYADRGWFPEPDVRVACWEIFENHPKIIRRMMERPDLYGEYEVKEAVIRAALAWVKEQHETK